MLSVALLAKKSYLCRDISPYNSITMSKLTSFLRSIWQAWQQSHLMLRIFIGIIIGAVLALTLPGVAPISMLGDLFVGALKAMAPILVAVLVMASVAAAGKGLGSRFRLVITLCLILK